MPPTEDLVHVLVVDDRPDKLLAIESILQLPGVQVVQAGSGREALRRLLEQDFAVILLDVKMPDMDGFETATLIRQRRRSEHTPIIFVTGFGDELYAARGYSLGAVDYILSPVVPEVLRTKVGVFVDLYRKTEQIQRQAEERVSLAQEQAARAAAEAATRRSQFLAEAGAVLARSLDFEDTVRSLLRLAVPELADLAAMTAADESGRPRQTELAWAFPPAEAVHQFLLAPGGPEDDLRSAVGRVLSAGEAETLDGLALAYPPAGEVPVQVVRTALVLPLRARGRMLGALTLGQGTSGRRFAAADLPLAEDLASRAAVALDNARLYREVQDADRQKNEFLAMLAHELRNPLAPLRNAAQVLGMADAGPGEQRWASEVIERQIKQMVRLVDDLLDVSRITRGMIALRAEPVDVTAVVAEALEASGPLIELRRHELAVDLPPEPVWARVDPARLAQVLANLLNNAAKYTEEGGRIGLRVERDADEVVFRVRDTGVGIPPEMLGRVFDLFTQVDRSLDRSQGGLGIGLTLVRRLVEMHGGRVEASSAGAGAGSEFVVRLPALAADPAGPEVNGSPPTAGRLPPLRTLIVDDNVDGADSLAILLRACGLEVRTEYDGPAALAAAAEFRPQAVLLDIGLPRMDGYEVARRLRTQGGLEKALLVAITGYGQEEDCQKIREAGFDHHFVKPVDHDALQEALAAAWPLAAEGPTPAPQPAAT